MELKYGLISADSHAGFAKDAYTSRMSASKWGDKIPQVGPSATEGLDGWSVYGRPPTGQVANCPALMGGGLTPIYPKRWEEVPTNYYDPKERLKALDADRIDAEVLFPNPPGNSFYRYGDPEFELDCVQAYNDILSEYACASDRYWALATIPWLQSPESIVRELERAAEGAHRGVNMLGSTPEGLPCLTDPHWDPVWDACMQLGLSLNFHGPADMRAGVGMFPRWSGYTQRQHHTAFTSPMAVSPAQIIPHLIFSGLTERFPDLKFVFAEAGIGGLNYALAAMDHEWETRHLWTEGMSSRPSETVRRQMFANFWFEDEGIKLRHDIGIDNLMWESDFPHVTAYFPHSWDAVERVLTGIPQEDRPKLLYENALRVYRVGIGG